MLGEDFRQVRIHSFVGAGAVACVEDRTFYFVGLE